MPKLVKFLMFHAGVGFALALMSVVAILGLNIANLGDLIMTSDFKWIAILALVVLMTITLASVQMAAAVMCLPYEKKDDDDQDGCMRRPYFFPEPELRPIPVERDQDRPLPRRRR